VSDGDDLVARPTVGVAIRRAARRFAGRDFIVMPGCRLTFDDAERMSRRLAAHLLATGIGKGTRVGLLFTYGPEFVVTWLALSRIGALAMPVSTTYRPAEVRRVLHLGDVDTLVVPERLLGRDVLAELEAAVPGLAGAGPPPHFLSSLPYLRRVLVAGTGPRPGLSPWATPVDLADPAGPAVDEAVLAAAEDEVFPADWALVVFTSGSSAEPKGVVHTHGAVIRDTASFAQLTVDQAAAAGVEARPFCAFPFFWVGGFLCLGAALHGGFPLLCLERFDPGEALDLIERERGTAVLGWPTLISAMRDHPSFATRDLASAPALVSAPADVALVDTPVPGIPAHRGMSETMGQHQLVEERAVDPESGAEVPEGEEGELAIRGPGLMAGYYKKERQDVFDAEGWFHTGDRVFMHGGRAYYVGRYTEMIKSQGANVSPREVELTLEEYPEVLHAFVVGLAHPERGEEVAAVLVPADGATIDPGELTSRARGDMSSFKVPTRIEVWPVERIPWLPSHKPDKRKIQSELAAR